MADTNPNLTKTSFAKTFVLPALLVFLVPVLSYFFFLHAQSRFDSGIRESILKQIRGDASLSAADRERAIEFFSSHPASELLSNQEFAANLESTTRFYYATFRWMIRLSLWSIIGGVAVFALAGICVVLSRRSQQAQYLSLTVGWQVLKLYSAVQVIVQGILLVALSFWVTALWFEVYFVKLIFVAGALALMGMVAVIKGIFTKVGDDMPIEGKVIKRDTSPRLWAELESICKKVGTAPPDQVIVGIDDNFFVTEAPVKVGSDTYTGRTLFVSLSMLKQMYGAEADSVLAHEMAHFSGNDTLYSKKISPLLKRYGVYLHALYESPITRPIFYFMNCFRALFALSLSEHSRKREYRADRIAADTTSPRDFAGALLRTAAYSDFRGNIQNELFKQERALAVANISEQIEQGFHNYAKSFAAKPDIGSLETAHPFDSHPPLSQRFGAIGVPLETQHTQSLVANAGDGRWFHLIDGAEEMEREQWQNFNEQFRKFHEETLPYRFLPESDEEREIVVKAFPPVSFAGKKGNLALDCETMHYDQWAGPVPYGDITNLTLNEGTLTVQCGGGKKAKHTMPMKTFGSQQQAALDALNRYYGRYMSAVAYQKQKTSGSA